MKVGLTYDLRSEYLEMGYSMEETAEFDKESTIEGIEEALQKAGYQTDRIGHARSLMSRLLAGDRWDLVFNIAEGLYGEGRESLVPALLDAWQIPYVFSGPVTLGVSLNKALTKQVVRAANINTPPFYLISKPEEIALVDLVFPLFAKPVSEGTGKGIDRNSKIENRVQLQEKVEQLLKAHHQPVLVEEFLPGREFTVGVLGCGLEAYVPGAMEIIYRHPESGIYSYETKENYTELVDYTAVSGDLLTACEEVALGAWRALGCVDGGRVDVKIDRNGQMSFIEVNPLAGLNPVISDLPILCRLNGMDYQELIGRIMHFAVKRIFGS